MPDIPLDDDPRPGPPPRPTMEDCCRGGCDPCVFDLYDSALERYEAELRAWRKRRDERGRR
ncbi:MAG TPA: oxidoreductase-like domain-containing protein [Casimicrobiaceae bacterium]|nr:oxidoreductase-like domain-containing protein [Casimicrobiaceae bacterium]